MKHYRLAAIFAASLLAACGGGGTSNPSVPSTPIPTATPTTASVVYTTKLMWTGLAARGVSAYDRIVEGYRSIHDVAFSSPVVMIAPDSIANAGSGANGSGAQLLVAASPMPSATPTTSFTVTAANVSVGASTTPPVGNIAAAPIVATAVGVASSGNAQAVVGTLPTPAAIPVIVFKAIHVGCGVNTDVPGVMISDTATETSVGNPASADLYVTGWICSGSYSVAKASANDGVFHVPSGAVVVTVPVGGFAAITVSQYTGATKTALTNSDVTLTTAFLFKNASGTVCKAMALAIGTIASGGADIEGPVACHGTSPDGF